MDWFGAKSKIAKLISIRPINYVFRWIAARTVPPDTAARFPVSVPQVVYRLTGGGEVILLDPVRDEVARWIYWGEGRCMEPSDQYALDCVEWLCRDSRTFLDIGAYSGLFGLVAARSQPNLKVITFEIVPENHLLVLRNVIENNLVGHIDARLCGLSGEPGSIIVAPSLHLDRLASSINIGSDFKNGVQIPIDILDNVVGEGDGPVVMKIDVEGFEAAVMRGGRKLFSQQRPDVICEILPRSSDFKDIEMMLRSNEYRFYQINDEGLRLCDQIDPSNGGRDWLFTVRKELPSELLQ